MSADDSWLQERRAFYDRISSVYDAMSDHYEHESRERGLELLGVAEGEAVLEIGYGTGHALESLARNAGSTGRVIAVDVSAGMQHEAAKRLLHAGLLNRVAFLQADGSSLPIPDHSIDAVFLSYTLELFEGPRMEALLAECRRVLKRNGKLGVVSLSSAPGESPAVRIYEWMHEKFPHFIDCRPINVARSLEAAGFAIEAKRMGSVWKLPVEIVVGRNT